MKRRYFIATLLVAATVPAFAGVEFMTKTSDARGTVTVAKGLVDGPRAKIEFVSGRGGPGMQKGNYMLSQDGGNTIYIVNPQEQSYMKLDVDKVAATAGQFMNAAKGFMNMTVSDPKIETLSDERGPKLHGYKTRHIKKRTSYTMTTSVFGRKDVTSISREDELWIADDLKDTGMQVWSKQRSVKTGHAEIDKLIEAEAAKLNGVPLKSVSMTTTKKSNGATEVTTLTNEITSLKKDRIPGKTFELPAGYKDSMAEMAAEMKRAGQEVEAETKNAPAGSPEEAINSLMKGLFGGGRK